ncbi:MAG TPA: hypothetical protein VJN22_01505 [Candidatus Eremiobacteraceae bacterium]|nr:hypothetical protein [Candidatus Eremiobacteraceae bacterium]
MADALDAEHLPTALTLPVVITVRNSDLGLNETGRVKRLDQSGLVASLPVAIPDGTVLFSTIDMRTLNATARGLVRVRTQTTMGDGAGFDTVADFIELNDDGKQKIDRLLSNQDSPPPNAGGFMSTSQASSGATRNFATDQIGLQPVYSRTNGAKQDFQIAPERKAYFEPAPIRGKTEASKSTKFWGSIGVTGYTIAILAVAALFPQGRYWELFVWDHVAWAVSRTWYWMQNIGNVKLYNNTP